MGHVFPFCHAPGAKVSHKSAIDDDAAQPENELITHVSLQKVSSNKMGSKKLQDSSAFMPSSMQHFRTVGVMLLHSCHVAVHAHFFITM
jgi:hypothetical protein